MNAKMTRVLVLIILVALNLGLAVYGALLRRQSQRVSQADMQKVLSLYEEAGVTFQETPSYQNADLYSLVLEPADLTGLTEEFLGDAQYNVSYIYGSAVQYTSDSLILLANQDEHTISYRDDSVPAFDGTLDGLTQERAREMLEPMARRFSERFLDSVILTDWSIERDGFHFVFREMADGQIYYFNTVTCVATMDGIGHAVVTCWDVAGRGGSVSALPMDEMLYAGLLKIQAEGDTPNTIEKITTGYILSSADETGQTRTAVPVQALTTSSGRVYMTRYSSE